MSRAHWIFVRCTFAVSLLGFLCACARVCFTMEVSHFSEEKGSKRRALLVTNQSMTGFLSAQCILQMSQTA